MEKYEMILTALKEMEDNDLMYLWNEYAQNESSYDDELFTMDAFNDIYATYDPIEVATRVFYGHDEWNEESSFNPNRDYFYFNGYGNPISIDRIGWNEYSNEFMFPYLQYGYERMIEDIISGDFETDNDEINEILEQ